MNRVLSPESWVLSAPRGHAHAPAPQPLRTQHSGLRTVFTQHSVLRTALAAIALLVFIVPTAFACPVCFGAPDDPMVKGVNNGIWVLLGLVVFVQLGFAALFYSFWRKARQQKRFRESFRVIHSYDTLERGGPLS
jgi:hypothetical protein